jgi:hypothetical protein
MRFFFILVELIAFNTLLEHSEHYTKFQVKKFAIQNQIDFLNDNLP